MSLIDRIAAERYRQPKAATYPTRDVPVDGPWGHEDGRFSPENYGDYLATSSQVFAAAQLRARLVSSVPLNLFKGRGADRKATPESHAAVATLARVNPFWTWERLARMDELCRCLWGETVWALEPGPDGLPAHIWWLKPSRVRPIVHESKYLQGFAYQPADGGKPIAFAVDEIVWQRYPNPIDEFSALSPLAAARLAADTGSAMMRANKLLFDQGLLAGGVIVPETNRVTFTQQQAEELEKQLGKRLKGVDKAHRWAVLRYEAQFRSMGVTPKDAEFAAGLNLTLRDVCNAYGIPSPMLNDMEHATLANAREFERFLWTNALVPDLGLMAAEIREQYLPRFRFTRSAPDHAEFDFSKVPALQEAESEVWSREYQAMEQGAITINEWRRSKGLPDVPWGDVWWAPVNKAPITDGDAAPTADEPGGVRPAADDETAALWRFRNEINEIFRPALLNGSH